MAQLLHLLTLLLISATIIVESSFASTFVDAGWGLSHITGGTPGAWTCNGVVGGCIGEDVEDEFVVGLEGEDVRRSLAGRPRYISYDALKRNQVPCNRRGQSYYGCGRASQANPYRRGCSKITRCQRNTG
ncbi:hypothetical protein Syun_027497 [Stephania yunnanensis]|uniref:Uncharacterized protein n=1 Tax=Stephania yunnanensis TaxID=152371 RepID=A0AAP0EFP2_9MAGN